MAVLLTLMLFPSLCCEILRSLGHTVSPEYGNEPSGSIQDGEFTDTMSVYQLLQKAIWTTVYVLHSFNVMVVISSKCIQVTQLKRQMPADNMDCQFLPA
jgi:hypothetical protein